MKFFFLGICISSLMAASLKDRIIEAQNTFENLILFTSQGPGIITFYVDSSIMELLIISEQQIGSNLELYDPLGKKVLPYFSFTHFNKEYLFFVQPSVGKWQMDRKTSSNSKINLQVKANSPWGIDSVKLLKKTKAQDFVEVVEPLERSQEVYFEIFGTLNKLENIELKLISLEGELLVVGKTNQGKSPWRTKFLVPVKPFRLLLEGQAYSGEKIQRIYASPFKLERLSRQIFRSPEILDNNCQEKWGIFLNNDWENPSSAILRCSKNGDSIYSTLIFNVSLLDNRTLGQMALKTVKKFSYDECREGGRLLDRFARKIKGSNKNWLWWDFECLESGDALRLNLWVK